MKPQRRLARLQPLSLSSLRPALLLAALSAVAQAQLPCGIPRIGDDPSNPGTLLGYTEVWVDPVNGNNATGGIGFPVRPFLTVNSALNALQGALGTPGLGNRGLVHLNAGIYSPLSNGEVFPIVMRDFIDIQGVGAKQVVLRGDRSSTWNTFLPTELTFGNCDCGSRTGDEVLVDFSTTDEPSYDEMLDAVTFQGGKIQVYAEGFNFVLQGRVSNCVFDMLDNSQEPNPLLNYPAPDFGVLMVHRFLGAGGGMPDDKDDKALEEGADGGSGPGYRDIEMHLFNNTFVQTWEPNPLDALPAQQALPQSVAICDVVDPNCFGSGVPDANRTLRGVGNPNIQNNLIRAFSIVPPVALMGIDDTDVTCSVGTAPGGTNAFDPAAVGPNNGVYCSMVLGSNPMPRLFAGIIPLNPNALTPTPGFAGFDPGFVGEALTSVTPGVIPFTHGRDWRILQDSALFVDQGTDPLNGLLTAANGTTHADLACSPSSSFDFDGEGWGNRRSEPSPMFPAASMSFPDIGFDESSILIDAGTVNDTVTHIPVAPSAFNNPLPGLGFHLLIYPSSGFVVPQDFHGVVITNTPLAFFPGGLPPAYTQYPGTAFTPTFPIPLMLAPWDVQWLQPPILSLFAAPLARLPYFSSYTGAAQAMSVGLMSAIQPIQGLPAMVAIQGLYIPVTGPNAGQIHLSNLQGIND